MVHDNVLDVVRRRIRGRGKQIRAAKCSGYTNSVNSMGSIVFGVPAVFWGKGDEKNRGNYTCVGRYPPFSSPKGPGTTAILVQSCKWLESEWQKGRSHTCATPPHWAFTEGQGYGMVCTVPLCALVCEGRKKRLLLADDMLVPWGQKENLWWIKRVINVTAKSMTGDKSGNVDCLFPPFPFWGRSALERLFLFLPTPQLLSASSPLNVLSHSISSLKFIKVAAHIPTQQMT